MVHNLQMRVLTLHNSKTEAVEIHFCDIVIIYNDHPRYLKHVSGRICVFFTLFGYWARAWGGGVP